MSPERRLLAGRYELLRKIAGGGMGEIFLARQVGAHGFEKQVVLKRILPEHAHDPTIVRAFLAEARIVASLKHPNVVDVYEVAEDPDGGWFLSMEYLPGVDLRRVFTEALLEGQPMPLGPALRIIADAARGLHHAHTAGVIHRDVSPHNLIVTRDGVTKVVDFGIAQIAGEKGDTEPGSVRGKRFYMAPEQIRGEEIDSRADQFALAVVLFELTTMSRLVADVGGLIGVRELAAGSIPRPRAVVPSFPERVDAPISRALSAERDGRFPDCAAFADELDTALEDLEIPSSPARVSRFLRALLGSIGADPARSSPPPAAADAPTAPVIGEPRVVEAPEVELAAEVRSRMDARRDERRSNLSDDRDFFVGREREADELRAQLQAGRVVTIVGTAGSGKTRFARHVAPTLAGRFPAGVWFVDLTEARSDHDVIAAVGRVLGVPLTEADPGRQLSRALAGREPLLLVLDNFEQVVSQAAGLPAAWQAAAPGLAVIVTSRERLRIANERVIEVDALELPRESEATESPAFRLFVESARRARPGWQPSREDAATITSIVRELDGLPLAIELAASRMAVLGLSSLLQRLSHRFDLLRGTSRGVTGKQATLAEALEWSWNLLQPWEQAALAQISVFRGGFSLEAAEAVIDLAAFPSAPWTLDVLSSLRDKSLLRSAEEKDFAGELRFSAYLNIQEFCSRKLSPQERAATESRHRAWFLHACGAWAAEADGHGGAARVRRLAAERDNLIAVVERSRAVGDADGLLGAALCLRPVLAISGPFDVFLRILDDSLARREAVADRRCVVDALVVRSRLSRLHGETDRADADAESALALAYEIGAGDLVAEASIAVATGLRERGRRDEARRLLREAEDRARDVGALHAEARAMNTRASMSHAPELQPEADRLYAAALDRTAVAGDRVLEVAIRANLSYLRLQQGRMDEARSLLDQVIAIRREIDDQHGLALSIGALGYLEFEAGSLETARRHLDDAVRRDHLLGNVRYEAYHRSHLALLDLFEGKARARAGLEEAVECFRRVGDRNGLEVHLAWLGAARAVDGDLPGARECLERFRKETSVVRPSYVVAVASVLSLVPDLSSGGRPEDARRRLEEMEATEAALIAGSEDTRQAIRFVRLLLERQRTSASGA